MSVDLDRRLARPDARLAFADSGGAGPAVLLLHGAGLDHTTFDEPAAALRRAGYRVVVWDLRGHGRSVLADGASVTAADALADLEALLAACDLPPPVLVGHSLGGNLAQAFVRQHPRAARGLVVLDATWNTGPLTASERLGLRVAAPLLATVPAARLPRLLARASATTPAAVARCEAVFARMPKARFREVWRATTSLVVPDAGYRSPVPLALVWGSADRTGNIAAAMPRWAAAEGVPEHVVDGAGHVLTWDAPGATTRILRQVLDGRGRAGGRAGGRGAQPGWASPVRRPRRTCRA